MINSKKGQDILLTVGILLTIIIVIVLGARIFTKLAIKNEPEFIAKEFAIAAEGVLAAPENIELKIKAPLPRIKKAIVGTWDGYFFFGEVDFKEGKTKGYALSSRVLPFRQPETEKDHLTEFNLQCDSSRCVIQPHKLLGDKKEEEKFVRDKSISPDDYGKFYSGVVNRTYDSTTKKYKIKTKPLEVK